MKLLPLDSNSPTMVFYIPERRSEKNSFFKKEKVLNL